MNTAEKIYHEVRSLPDMQAQEVLDFVGYLKSKQKKSTDSSSEASMAEFDPFAAACDGKFNFAEAGEMEKSTSPSKTASRHVKAFGVNTLNYKFDREDANSR